MCLGPASLVSFSSFDMVSSMIQPVRMHGDSRMFDSSVKEESVVVTAGCVGLAEVNGAAVN